MFRENWRSHHRNAGGQAAVEYLLLAGMVLIAFSGIAAVFSNQVQNYLGWPFGLIQLPF